jgi:Na+/melibiose symporter-like transporter
MNKCFYLNLAISNVTVFLLKRSKNANYFYSIGGYRMGAEVAVEQVSVKKAAKDKVGAWRMVAWQSRSISLGCNMLILGFLTIYCTDTLKMPAALVGTLLMASKLFDGVTDLFAGFIVDKTNTKIGRGRPYELSIIGVWLCTWLMFACPPEFSMVAKAAWVFAMYAFVNSIFATLLNASNTVYMVRAFSKQEHYVAISSYGSIIVFLSAIAVNVSFPILMAQLATSAGGWKTLITIYTVPFLLIGLLRFFFIKETNNVDAVSGEKVNFKELMSVLKSNRYIYTVAIMLFVFSFVTNMGVGVYYFTYVVKDVGLMGPLALTQVIILPLVFLFPPIIRKFSTTKLILAGLLLMSLGALVNFFAMDNFILLVLGGILTGAGAVPVSMLSGLMIIDCADYNEWQGRPRAEGTLGSVTGFTTKLGAAIGAGVMGVLLSMSGYTGDVSTQPESADFIIRMLFSIIPMVLYLLVAFTLKFYKLDKLVPQIRKENEERRKQMGLTE